jgi:hypothetical protein
MLGERGKRKRKAEATGYYWSDFLSEKKNEEKRHVS